MARTRGRLFGRLYDREELEAKGRINVPGYSGKYRDDAYGKRDGTKSDHLVDQMADLLARKRNSHAIAKIGLIQQSVNPKKDKKHWT